MNLREIERQSIRNFVQHCADAGHFRDKDVLDYGCGKQPYRDIVVMGGGRWTGFDRVDFPGSTAETDIGVLDDIEDGEVFGAVLCTQMVQYVENVSELLDFLRWLIRPGGCLCITWPTNWPEVEKEDLHRFTIAGFARLLDQAGYRDIGTTPRAFMDAEGSRFYLGHGAVAWK